MTLYISRKFRHVPRCHDDLYDLSYDNSKLQLLYTVVEFSMIKEEFLYNVYK